MCVREREREIYKFLKVILINWFVFLFDFLDLVFLFIVSLLLLLFELFLNNIYCDFDVFWLFYCILLNNYFIFSFFLVILMMLLFFDNRDCILWLGLRNLLVFMRVSILFFFLSGDLCRKLIKFYKIKYWNV